jgi:hypothetical protein
VEADGYATYDDYDNGSRNQKGATPTGYGTREQLRRCLAVFRANGIHRECKAAPAPSISR